MAPVPLCPAIARRAKMVSPNDRFACPRGRPGVDSTPGQSSRRVYFPRVTRQQSGPGADRATFSANVAKRGADGSAFGWWKVSDVLGVYVHFQLGYAFGNSTMDARGGGALVWSLFGYLGSCLAEVGRVLP